jgi:DNA processing protein
VLGNGLGVVYPAANRQLYERVGAGGLLLTEFPPGERPTAGSFPRRNRIISGLARVTVVVEAAEGSGALITAGTALDQGRDVMAVPGPITSPRSTGCNRLIRDGATPLLEMRDLLDRFPDAVPPLGARPLPQAPPAPPLCPLPAALGEVERTVAGLLGREPVVLEELIARSGRTPHELLAALCGLEISGVVEQGPGRTFRRV